MHIGIPRVIPAPERPIRARRVAARVLLAAGVLFLTLVAAGPIAAQSPNEALFQAVELNDMAAVDAAITAGADLSAKNGNGMTPADVAVDLGHFRIAHALLAKRIAEADAQPRVTDKGKAALSNPRQRIPAPVPESQPAQKPVPALSNLLPPKKPIRAPTPRNVAPAPNPPAADTAAPVPATEVPRRSTEPRLNDEIAANRPVQKKADPAKENDGLLDGILGGLKTVVTLGGLIGGEEESPPKPDIATPQRKLVAPADRFRSRPPATQPSSLQESDSAAGRMVDRMTGMIGSDQPPENEFGLPQTPVVPPVGGLEEVPGIPPVETAERGPADEVPGLAPPTLAAPKFAPPEITPPSDSIDVSPPVGEVPGLVAPADEPVPGTLGELAPPSLPDGPAPPDPEDVPGLPPGLEVPGLEAPGTDDEVPGIIPAPSASGDDIPGLPPGLEPLLGADTGQLRRPGGLIEPENTNVLPAPGSQDLQDRLKRFDDILSRSPTQTRRTYSQQGRNDDRRPGTPPVREAPKKGAVTSAPADPLMETPKGIEEPDTRIKPESSRDTEAILRRARESDGVKAERRRFDEHPRVRSEDSLIEPSRHALRPPAKGITARDEPTTRMMDRLSNLTGNPYADDDIHGLPVVRPSVDGTMPPRKDVDVVEVPDPRREKADGKIHALARFFRGDPEQQAGMEPPLPKVESVPLPRVIDNMLPEDDPARTRIVDDRMLDLSGVQHQPQSPKSQPGATPTRDGRIDERFLDRLTSVIGPVDRRPRIDGDIPPEPGTVGLGELDVPSDQMRKPARPEIPDPWTMTVEKSGPAGEKQTLGISAISSEDGSEIEGEQGVVSKMVGRIRQLLGGDGPNRDAKAEQDIKSLDEADRQAAAEKLLSDALRDGAPTALPDQNQWPVTEIEAKGAPPGVPPKPRPGALTRTSMDGVVLSLGESVTLENTLPPQQDGLDPLNECVKKNRGTTLFCVEPVDWPNDLRPVFVVPTILYTGPMAITRYDQGSPSRFHALFSTEDFEDVVAYYQARYGEPTEIWKRSIAPLAKPRMDNPTVTWRSRDPETNAISVLEIRKFDDTRGGFPDTNRGAIMLYYLNAPSIFPQVSSHELMRLRRTR